MYNFPKNTRNDYKKDRENFSMPSALPSPINPTYGEAMPGFQPNYDRNMFSISNSIEQPPRRMINDRLTETTQIYNNFGKDAEFRAYSDVIGKVDMPNIQSRARREQEFTGEEKRNMERMLMGNCNYEREVGDRVRGFDLVARDTRYDTKKMDGGNIEMRANRYLGMPSDKF